ncbi:Peptidyl-prolyl [Seminavis robusta]|uniref:peptidylprolyl isomerase n=1 Tax=Seminavis robusta TaxID=568900 RepID=A0A9N8H6Y6_9STRA|nr:Peptidyl-prolyl [Seminavis robusta]|eukprot:Sro56_g032690.1 Peptidyl-prolyl (559) ;mRNA; r:41767-43443
MAETQDAAKSEGETAAPPSTNATANPETASTQEDADNDKTADVDPADDTKNNDTEEHVDDDDDDTSSTGSEDSDLATPPSEDPYLVLVKATNHKEEGNAHFKANALDKAVREYRKGTNLLKPFNKSNTGDEQVKALLVTLQNNLSMVFFKQNKTKVSRDIATKSLKIDPKNVKALYRRACAHKKMGDLELARDDLKEALKHDASNAAVKKELALVKKTLVDYKTKQKKALASAFSSSGKGSSLYEDKEKEKQKKVEAEKKKKEQEAKELEQRKQQWEDECVKRMAKGDEAISFDDWEKERKAEEDERKKQEEKRQKEERKAQQAAKKAAAAAKKAEQSDSSDDELTATELASLRGYKKTADGRVTSYFTREQSEHEKKIIGNIAPQRLEQSSTPTLLNAAASGDSADSKKKRPSAWNQAGTWEEKDTTKWCTDKLRDRLLQAKCQKQPYTATISKVDSLTGDASVAITNGKKRYIFDYHVKLKLEIRNDDDDEAVAEGTLHIPDICSTSHDELEVNFAGWKKAPGSAHRDGAVQCQQGLITEIRGKVQQWVEDFNQHY